MAVGVEGVVPTFPTSGGAKRRVVVSMLAVSGLAILVAVVVVDCVVVVISVVVVGIVVVVVGSVVVSVEMFSRLPT